MPRSREPVVLVTGATGGVGRLVGPEGVADMLLVAWRAALGQPAFVTSAVEEVVGVPARTVSAWAADHAEAFARTHVSAGARAGC